MQVGEEREKIDNELVKHMMKVLIKYGVKPSDVWECYDCFRFQLEARAVLLNRVPDRNGEKIGYYGAYLAQTAKQIGVEYSPCED